MSSIVGRLCLRHVKLEHWSIRDALTNQKMMFFIVLADFTYVTLASEDAN